MTPVSLRKILSIWSTRWHWRQTVPMLKWQSQLCPSWRKAWNVQFATRFQEIFPSPAVRQVTLSVNFAEAESPFVQLAEEVLTPTWPTVLQQTRSCWSTISASSHSMDVMSKWSWMKLLFMRKLVRRELSFVLDLNARKKCSWGSLPNMLQSQSVVFPGMLNLNLFCTN